MRIILLLALLWACGTEEKSGEKPEGKNDTEKLDTAPETTEPETGTDEPDPINGVAWEISKGCHKHDLDGPGINVREYRAISITVEGGDMVIVDEVYEDAGCEVFLYGLRLEGNYDGHVFELQENLAHLNWGEPYLHCNAEIYEMEIGNFPDEYVPIDDKPNCNGDRLEKKSGWKADMPLVEGCVTIPYVHDGFMGRNYGNEQQLCS